LDPHYAAQYKKLHEEHWWWQARAVHVLRVVRSLKLQPPSTILDIGCGGGWAFDQWERFGDVYGVELDPTLVAMAGRHEARIHLGPFDSTYQPERKFSLIVMLDVLEHLERPGEALTHALELLQPDGHILITVPAMPSAWTSHDELNHHFVRFTAKSFGRLARDCEMKIDRLEYFFQWTTLVKWGIRIKESVFGATPQSPRIPHPIVNRFLRAVCSLEQHTITQLKPPLGTSLLCLGTRNRGRVSRPDGQ
jgi:SAM-dependent methyltransferase